MPDWKNEIRLRLAGLKLEAAREIEIIEELSQHLDDRYHELRSGGVSDDEASRAALAELSDNELLPQELRRVEAAVAREPIVMGTNRSANMLGNLWMDLRFGVRMLARRPARSDCEWRWERSAPTYSGL